MANWHCVKQCGACCHLDPTERPDLAEYLTPEELELYLGLVGEDGWCINFNHLTRECQIYSSRPRFCRVEPEVFQDLYGIESNDLNDFAVKCCQQQIAGVYGNLSLEMQRFNRAISISSGK
ncbi:MAG: YkgJ family cysteine cluster protein [Chroococcidiopsidaceae cyanobacterium CP_BM_ER_R8_30]|nr:YkgJ family cysteine cluster protein [Chroococcidiopsidaceae cyanobacterium CP_BM_ER_R8_30]